VYATDLMDGYRVDETLRMDAGPSETLLETMPAAVSAEVPISGCGQWAVRR
jgi:hypothetical protein